jgi:capsular polysaccharide transport system permease protein
MNVARQKPRQPLEVAASVWYALLMREALQRLFFRRAAWVWLFAEPLFHASYLTIVYTLIRVRSVGGIDTVIWLLSGLMGFFLFRHTASRVSAALGANRTLFAYRQVKLLDVSLARAVLEGALITVVIAVAFTGAALIGHSFVPDEPLAVLLAFISAWLLGFGWGLIVSVASDIVPELANILDFVSRPLYLISGVVFPLSVLPPTIRELLMLNPVAHVLEEIRRGIASHYHAVPESTLAYPYLVSLAMVFTGLLLLRRFEWKMVAR